MKRIGLLKVGLKKRYCSEMPSVVSAIDGTSHEMQIPSNEPQEKNMLSANQLFSLIEMKRKLINSVNFVYWRLGV
jgi:hypothetical protein